MSVDLDQIQYAMFGTIVQWWFKNISVPVITLFLTVIFRASSKKIFRFERNDGFVCFDICTSAIFVFSIGMIDLANQVVNPIVGSEIISTLKDSKVLEILKSKGVKTSEIERLPDLLTSHKDLVLTKFGLSSFIMMGMLLAIIVIIGTTRTYGWNDSGTEIKWLWGIIIPNGFSLLLLITAAIWINI